MHSLRLEARSFFSELIATRGSSKGQHILGLLSARQGKYCSLIHVDTTDTTWDISLCTITPSSQLDGDIDIDLSSSTSHECGSFLSSIDGQSRFDLFRTKVQLGDLEGRIYNTLLSDRFRKLSHQARGRSGGIADWRTPGTLRAINPNPLPP